MNGTVSPSLIQTLETVSATVLVADPGAHESRAAVAASLEQLDVELAEAGHAGPAQRARNAADMLKEEGSDPETALLAATDAVKHIQAVLMMGGTMQETTPAAPVATAVPQSTCAAPRLEPQHTTEETTMNATLDSEVRQSPAQLAGDLGGKYLTFKLGVEEYGLEILKVHEIVKMMPITRVPRTADFVKGVLNLRGKVIPVIDLRAKFGMETVEETNKTCIIVVQVLMSGGTVTMGIIVDEVSEVLDIETDAIEPAPPLGTAVDTAFILGIAKAADGVKILLDSDKVLSSAEMRAVKTVAREEEQEEAAPMERASS